MELTSGVHLIDGVRGANAYLVTETELALVDSGLPGNGPRILAYLNQLGHQPHELRWIVITHGDLDHIGSAAPVAEASGAQVCAHRAEVDIIEGRRRPGPLLKGLLTLFSPLFRLRRPRIDRPLNDGDTLAGLRVVWTPGHSPGSISLIQDDVLIVGDLLQCRGAVSVMPGIVTEDAATLRESIAKVAGLDFNWLLPGHGTPLAEAAPQVRDLAARLS